jgi:hypothetical protein
MLSGISKRQAFVWRLECWPDIALTWHWGRSILCPFTASQIVFFVSQRASITSTVNIVQGQGHLFL